MSDVPFDLFLQALIKVVNGGGPRYPITLLVGGAIIKGKLVGYAEYSTAQRPDMSQRFEDLGPLTEEPLIAHLANASVNGADVGWWRVLLHRVDGFSLSGASQD